MDHLVSEWYLSLPITSSVAKRALTHHLQGHSACNTTYFEPPNKKTRTVQKVVVQMLVYFI